MSQRRQPYIRATKPPPIRLTTRDIRILEAIHAYDGLLSLKQIDQLFFSGKGRSQPQARMRQLFDHGYVKMPTPTTIHQVPLGETMYWLDRKGAAVVAALQGMDLRQFTWHQRPRYLFISHDLAVNDFRLAVMSAIEGTPHLSLGTWLPESLLRSQPDKVEYRTGRRDMKRRSVIPDGFFTILWQQSQQPKIFTFLLEIDMGTEDNPRFAREKVHPGVAYLKSEAFQERFGVRYARYLVVTTGGRRLQNMKAQTEQANGNGYFYFTTFAQLQNHSPLTEPIWWLAGQHVPQAIVA